jgi:hypothetical protein
VSDTISLPPGSPLRALIDRAPTLVVFLRHFGCTFCREALADVAAARPAIEATGTSVAFVHGVSPDEAQPWFERYELRDALQVSDPALRHYRAFGLGNLGAMALIDPQVWARGAVCALSHGFGRQPPELMRQLPGVFVVHGDRVLAAYRHKSAADRPDYLGLVRHGSGGVTLSSTRFPF